MRRWAATLLCGLVLAGGVVAGQSEPLGQPSLEGFTAVDQPEGVEQIPAVRLVVTAYAFVWVALIYYVWTIWRRLGKVDAELQQLAKKSARRS